jgi:alkanesulfonate monooxygenase SsuD/methylene tetrahydromethanopterin reductase-like flavin-dependent oxidoreductase (luciferase family)
MGVVRKGIPSRCPTGRGDKRDYDPAQMAAVEVGVFVIPDAAGRDGVLEQVALAESVGLDLVGIQDHPYQRRFLETMTLLAFCAARTERIRLFPDVANLPLREPAVLAKAAATIDLLSGGRFELGLGAGAFWEAIGAMGGPMRSPGESVEALEEAIAVVRAMWSGERTVEFSGRHYSLSGLHPGPAPAHDIGIWLGAYGPRMMGLTGRAADGWIPTLPRLALDEVPPRHALIDEAARSAGRDPSAVKRIANVDPGDGFLEGGVDEVVSQLESLHRDLRFEAFVFTLGDDPSADIARLGEEIAPALRAA